MKKEKRTERMNMFKALLEAYEDLADESQKMHIISTATDEKQAAAHKAYVELISFVERL